MRGPVPRGATVSGLRLHRWSDRAVVGMAVPTLLARAGYPAELERGVDILLAGLTTTLTPQ